jgi:hypothetical protein
MLYCRQKIYPLGLPNGVAHAITALALLAKLFLKVKASFLPRDVQPLAISVREKGQALSGRFSLLAVTTLEKMLLSIEVARSTETGVLKMLVIDERPSSMLRAFAASLRGKLGQGSSQGVHFQHADEITIESDSSDVILDGETFRAERGRPITLRPAQPLSFVKLAA